MPRSNRPPAKDMYWFAHGGLEQKDKVQNQKTNGELEEEGCNDSHSLPWRGVNDRKVEDLKSNVTDGHFFSGPSSLDAGDRTFNCLEKRQAVEERKKQLQEAEQERSDAVLRKRMERDAAVEARRNAQRCSIQFAFGKPVFAKSFEPQPESLIFDQDSMSRSYHAGVSPSIAETQSNIHDRQIISSGAPHTVRFSSPSSWLVGSGAIIDDDLMSRSMTASMHAQCGRRKNDLMPTVPYNRTPEAATQSRNGTAVTRKRSVSMSRLDQLAKPRRHYVEAVKNLQNQKSPNRPQSSASEQSGGSGNGTSNVVRRNRQTPRKPRPVSVAGTFPDTMAPARVTQRKPSPVKKVLHPPAKKITVDTKKTPSTTIKPSPSSKSAEKVKVRTTPNVHQSPSKPTTPKPSTSKVAKQPSEVKSKLSSVAKAPATKNILSKVTQAVKKKVESVVAAPKKVEEVKFEEKPPQEVDVSSTTIDPESEEKSNGKKIISEEEAKAALAEKRRLAREQAEKEAELERQKLEEERLAEEERLRREEEEQRRFEEEQTRLHEEHARIEVEKLKKAIEEQQRIEEEEKAKRDEEMQQKAEQERKAKEEAEKQRLELEEKLRKEEEERAERKKRLEKIMSRTRGKSNGTSPSGSISGSDHIDSGGENQLDVFSSGGNSLESNEGGEMQVSAANEHIAEAEQFSGGDSMEGNPTFDLGSEIESLNSNDLMLPNSEDSLVEKEATKDAHSEVQNNLFSASLSEMEDLPTPVVEVADPVGFVAETEDLKIKQEYPAKDEAQLAADIRRDEKMEELTYQLSNLEQDPMMQPIYQPSDIGDQMTESVYNPDFGSEVYAKDLMAQSVFQPSGFEGSMHNASEFDDGGFGRQQLFQSEAPGYDQDLNGQSGYGVSRLSDFSDQVSFRSAFVDEMQQKEMVKRDSGSPASVENQNETGSDLKENILNPEHIDITFDNRPNTVEKLSAQFSEPDNLHSSISSDIKLPDPIYETSEDGSVSSEKYLPDFRNQPEFNFAENSAGDDVFREQVVSANHENVFQSSNPFGESDHRSSFAQEHSEGGYFDHDSIDSELAFNKTEREDIGFKSSAFDGGAYQTQMPSESNLFTEQRTLTDDRIPSPLLPDPVMSQGIFSESEAFGATENSASGGYGDHYNALKNSEPLTQNSEPLTYKNVTLVPAGDGFGLISSVDNDRFLNEQNIFESQQHHIQNNYHESEPIQNNRHESEQQPIQNNYQYVTDSEESSLDSNLSQVEVETKANGLVKDDDNRVPTKGEDMNELNVERSFQDGSMKAANPAVEVYRNGHNLESPKGDPLVGDLIEDGAYAMNGKGSPDPFLGKGPQGNPFLLSDDQNHVLLRQDIMN